MSAPVDLLVNINLRAARFPIPDNKIKMFSKCGVHLYEDPPAQPGLDERLCDPASRVRRRAVDLGEVLAGEGAASVSSPAAVRVDDDLPSGQTCVTLQTQSKILYHRTVNQNGLISRLG